MAAESEQRWNASAFLPRHCEERSDAAIQGRVNRPGLLRSARNDDQRALVGSTNRIIFPQESRSAEHTSELQSLMRISYAVYCSKKQQRRSKSVRLHTRPTATTPVTHHYPDPQ